MPPALFVGFVGALPPLELAWPGYAPPNVLDPYIFYSSLAFRRGFRDPYEGVISNKELCSFSGEKLCLWKINVEQEKPRTL